jgi:hypothetical protein
VNDSITILKARGRRLAKLIEAPERIVGYDDAKTFDATERPLASLDDLERLVRALLRRPDCCVVRGSLIGGPTRHRIRRLIYSDPDTGDAPTLRASPRCWLALDLDGVELDPEIPAHDLARCAAAAVRALPIPFGRAALIAQATASHGLKPGMRLRLWFWLSRPTSGDELKRWLRAYPVDCSVFSAAQINYTAAPVLAAGVADPVPTRIVRLPGAETVQVPDPSELMPPPRPASAASEPVDPAKANDEARQIIARVLFRLSRSPNGEKHYRLRTAGYTIGGLLAATGTSFDAALRQLIDSARAAGKIEDEANLEATAKWALERGRESPLKVGGSR